MKYWNECEYNECSALHKDSALEIDCCHWWYRTTNKRFDDGHLFEFLHNLDVELKQKSQLPSKKKQRERNGITIMYHVTPMTPNKLLPHFTVYKLRKIYSYILVPAAVCGGYCKTLLLKFSFLCKWNWLKFKQQHQQ